MTGSARRPGGPERRLADRSVTESLFVSLRGLGRNDIRPQVLAGVTLLAIAIPEQLATSQLAGVPAFLAMIAFLAATVAFVTLGSNPVLSVGADSTIAPLFAVAAAHVAVAGSAKYLVMVSAIAVGAGLLVTLVGVARLGWLADFLSLPIVAGFMTGMGVVIIAHQLPHATGVAGVEGSFWHRIAHVATHLSEVNTATVVLTVLTILLVVVGERVAPRAPVALVAVVVSTLAVSIGNLGARGVATLGDVVVGHPVWRFGDLSIADLATVISTSAVVAVVIISQSAATTRVSADELGVAVNVDRDFIGVGAGNILSGLLGSFAVNASPARTTIALDAGGRSQVVGLVAAAGALLVAPLAPWMKDIPLAVLAGILMVVASRLIKVRELRDIAHVDRAEFALAVTTALAVIVWGVQQGLALAVALAIVDRTRRSARPTLAVLGRLPGTTSWELLGRNGARSVGTVLTLIYGAPLYFANAAHFRTQVHASLRANDRTTAVVLDAAAMTDIDFTGLNVLAQITSDLARDGVALRLARASEALAHSLSRAPDEMVRTLGLYDSVDLAVEASQEGRRVQPPEPPVES